LRRPVVGASCRRLCDRVEPRAAYRRGRSCSWGAVGGRLRPPDHRSTADAEGTDADRTGSHRSGDGGRLDGARRIDCRAITQRQVVRPAEDFMPIQGYPDPGNGLRLHLNENTGGCSPRVLEAIRRVQTSDVATDPSYPVLVHACAAHFNVDPDWVLLTNGLDEGILMAALGHIARARAFDAETIVPLPAFDPYPNASVAVGATPVQIPPRPGYVFQVDEVIAAITPRTKMIFLNTPNNPT